MTVPERIADFLDRHRVPLLVAWSICVAVPTMLRAAAKPFWHDEIYTVLLARLPSISAHWAALRDGVDFAPPLNGFATRAVRHLGGIGPLVARIPPMIGFWTMAMAIFAIVRERGNATLAFAAISLTLFTAGYRYSYEARPYGLMMGLAALAWFAWLRAAAGSRRGVYLTLLGVSLTAGLWNHYYAALTYAPIAVGEAVRTMRRRRVDAAVWAVVAGSIAAAAPLIPLVRLSATRTAHFWVAPSFADIPATYAFLFGGLAQGFAWPLAGIAAITLWGRFRSPARSGNRPGIPAHEIAALVAALLIPALGVLLALVATGAFVARYALTAVFAVAVGVPLVIGRLERRARVAELALLLVFAFAFVQSVPPFSPVPAFSDPVAARPLLANALREPGPTVISGELMFLQLWYYSPVALRPQLVYLADPQRALRYRESDNVDLNYLALARWTAVPVEPFDRFVRTHSAFRVYAAGSGWQLDGIRDMRMTVDLIGTDPGGRLFSVRQQP